MKKKILSFFLSFCLIISYMVGFSITASADASGSCGANGDNLTWSYTESNKTLTISGTGAMADNCRVNAWPDLITQIENVVINSGVTSIGENAFTYCQSLTSVSIPNTVTEIGAEAFDDCASLASITIPNSVTSIEYGVFEDCSSLTTVNYDGSPLQWATISASSGLPSGVTVNCALKDMSSCTIDTIANQTYTGNPITPEPVVKDGTTTLTKDTHYTVLIHPTHPRASAQSPLP